MWPHTHTHGQNHTHWAPRLPLFPPAHIYPHSQQLKHFITHSPRQRSLAIRHSYVSSLKLFCHSLRPPSIPIHKPNLVLSNSQNPPEHSGMSSRHCPNHSTSQHTHTHRIHLSHLFVQGLERVNTNKQMGQLARWRAAAGSSPFCETMKLRNHPSGPYPSPLLSETQKLG